MLFNIHVNCNVLIEYGKHTRDSWKSFTKLLTHLPCMENCKVYFYNYQDDDPCMNITICAGKQLTSIVQGNFVYLLGKGVTSLPSLSFNIR